MMEALPNAHAAVLHFPIVLLPVAIALEAIGLVRRSNIEIERLSAIGWLMLAVSTGVTFLLGRAAADGLSAVPPKAQFALAAHADAAWVFLIGVLAVFLLRMGAFALRDRARTVVRTLTALLGCVLALQLVATADRGGALVYGHALAVQLPAVPQPECPPCEGTDDEVDAAPTWSVASDGSGTWEPRPGDLREGRQGVRALGSAQETGDDVFTVRADERALVLAPGSWGNVQVNVSVDLSAFEGTVGVVHHVSSAEEFDAFEMSTRTGVARLVRHSAKGPTILHEAESGPAPAILSVSAAGSHLKGLLDGNQVSHGHARAVPDGAVGLLLNGEGEVRLLRLEVIPLGAH